MSWAQGIVAVCPADETLSQLPIGTDLDFKEVSVSL